MDTIAKGLASRLRKERERSGLSLRDLGRLAGVPHANIQRFEHGKRLPSLPTLFRLARALGAQAVDLLPRARP